MHQPRDGRVHVPTNRQPPARPADDPDPPGGTDVPYPRRSSRRFAGEGTGRHSGFDRPETDAGTGPTVGYYSAAAPQRPAPSAGRAPGAGPAARSSGNPAGRWSEPYPEHRRGNASQPDPASARRDADDDWDTQVFSLLPDRASASAADGHRDRPPQRPRQSYLDEREDTGPPDGAARTEAGLARQVAAIASLAAGVVHVFATPTHWQEWTLAGAFFATAAGFQLLWGLLALPIGNVFIRVTGLLANIGLLGLWAVSRWYGVPFGPHAGVPEAFGAADLIVAAMEVAIVVGLLWSLLPRERHGVLSVGGHRAVVVLAFVVLGAMAVPGSTAALEHSHSHDSETADHEDDGHDHEHGTDGTADMESPADSEGSSPPEQGTSEPAEEDHTHAPGEEHD